MADESLSEKVAKLEREALHWKNEAHDYRQAHEAELDGNKDLREKFGARLEETFPAFVERLHREARSAKACAEAHGYIIEELCDSLKAARADIAQVQADRDAWKRKAEEAEGRWADLRMVTREMRDELPSNATGCRHVLMWMQRIEDGAHPRPNPDNPDPNAPAHRGEPTEGKDWPTHPAHATAVTLDPRCKCGTCETDACPYSGQIGVMGCSKWTREAVEISAPPGVVVQERGDGSLWVKSSEAGATFTPFSVSIEPPPAPVVDTPFVVKVDIREALDKIQAQVPAIIDRAIKAAADRAENDAKHPANPPPHAAPVRVYHLRHDGVFAGEWRNFCSSVEEPSVVCPYRGPGGCTNGAGPGLPPVRCPTHFDSTGRVW